MNDSALGMQVLAALAAAAIAFFVAKDANSRGMNGLLWGLGVFFLCIIFLPIYLFVRKPLVTPSTLPAGAAQSPPPPTGAAFCKNCGNALQPGARFCEKCGTAA
jgi:hypothetical protein